MLSVLLYPLYEVPTRIQLAAMRRVSQQYARKAPHQIFPQSLARSEMWKDLTPSSFCLGKCSH